MFVDVAICVPPSLPVSDATVIETRIADALVNARREVAEVRIKFVPTQEEKDK